MLALSGTAASQPTLAAVLTGSVHETLTSVAFSPDGTMLAAGVDGKTYVWDVATRRLTATLIVPGGRGQSVTSVAFSPDARTLAVSDTDDSTYLLDLATGHVIATVKDGPPRARGGVYSVAFSPNGTMLAADDYNGHIYLWHVG